MGEPIGEGTPFACKVGRSPGLEGKTLPRPFRCFHSPAFPLPSKPPLSPQPTSQLQLEARGLASRHSTGPTGLRVVTLSTRPCLIHRKHSLGFSRAQAHLSAVSFELQTLRSLPSGSEGVRKPEGYHDCLLPTLPSLYQVQHPAAAGAGPPGQVLPLCPTGRRLLLWAVLWLQGLQRAEKLGR